MNGNETICDNLSQINIYVINLARDQDRWASVSSELNQYGLAYERINAVDGKQLTDFRERFSPNRFRMVARHDLVAGEAGCSLSHIGIWERIDAEDIAYAIVLEDDVVISPEIVNFIKERAYLGFDYLKIDTDIKNYRYSTVALNRKTIGNFEIVECDPVPYNTGGYVISARGARVFLRVARSMFYPIDFLPHYSYPYTKHGYTTPALVLQEGFDSGITGRDFQPERGLVDRLGVFVIKLFSRYTLRRIAVQYRKFSLKIRSIF